ncbi:MAG: hypothetical protein CBB87_09270 [Micavibrio sp. TMED27]|nr:hypothetical protein [Micavibrio sp.]OUT90330.1 MAG: hypothetical protein CBB87_09270 [Micavibrio sp. TMED27]
MSKPSTNFLSIVILGLCVSSGIAAAGYFVGQMMYNAKVALNTAEVKGLSERRVRANRANWSMEFNIAGNKKGQIPALYKQMEENRDRIVELLKKDGFDDDEIKTGVIDYFYREYRDENQTLVDQSHALRGTVNVETDKVDLIEKVRGNINKLIAEGISIQNRMPKYYFTNLNEIKPDMLKEATQNAKVAANEFAESAGAKVGRIRSARQGGFIIRDAGEEYGDTQKIEKDVRVVTTISFYLTD